MLLGLIFGVAAVVANNGIKIQAIPSSLSSLGFSKWFTQYVNIFGVNILASSKVEKSHLLHAANVMAQYLDSDGDSVVDNEKVGKALIASGATLVMFGSPDNYNMRKFFRNPPDNFNYQDLESSEVVPTGVNTTNVHDATIEEVYHLLTCNGWANVYPQVFGCDATSQIGKTMVNIIGDCGYAFNKTHKEPPNCSGKYHYSDETCNFACLVVEYTYWATTTLLGYQEGPPLGPKNRCKDINNEWQMCTPALLNEYDPAVVRILGYSEYKIPRVLPDGKYTGTVPDLPASIPGDAIIYNDCTS